MATAYSVNGGGINENNSSRGGGVMIEGICGDCLHVFMEAVILGSVTCPKCGSKDIQGRRLRQIQKPLI